MLDHFISSFSSLHLSQLSSLRIGHLLWGAFGLVLGLIWHWYRIASAKRSLDVEDARLANERLVADGAQYDQLQKQWKRKSDDLDGHKAQLAELEAERDTLAAEARGIRDRLRDLGNERDRSKLDLRRNQERSAELEKKRPNVDRRLRTTQNLVNKLHKRLLEIERNGGEMALT